MNIRSYLTGIFLLFLTFIILFSEGCKDSENDFKTKAEALPNEKILLQAQKDLEESPVTITSYPCIRSAGGIHDFYSEGDYWWPNPENPDGPYIQRDGISNPDNFTAHREVMIRFSMLVGNLASAFIITGNNKYMEHAMKHTKAWFFDTSSCMNPSLLYVQAIKGRFTGRGVGIIDAIQLMEVTQPFLLFSAISYNNKEYFKTWNRLDHFPQIPEVLRNLPIRNPLIWF